MKTLIGMILGLVLICTSFSAAKAAEYVLAPGDVLNIRVAGYEELEMKAVEIRPDNKIDFPLLGEIDTNGLTPGQLARKLAAALGEYLREPQVSINVNKFHTTRIYVLGEVNKPGLYELSKQHNLLDAIGAAGGYTKDAAKKKVVVIPAEHAQKPYEVNFLQLLQKGDIRLNVRLADGDVVYLTSNNRIDIARDILPIVNGLYYLWDIRN